ncbi:unnamed protein product [Cuscuta campestris]|uniref:Uncharacterized protein n=1 Tax=Cuscuta campestris TaxID=132261 RepID=A0A484M4E7_9ASTE|nr:unnamed protein product [Cuscuta campestris]
MIDDCLWNNCSGLPTTTPVIVIGGLAGMCITLALTRTPRTTMLKSETDVRTPPPRVRLLKARGSLDHQPQTGPTATTTKNAYSHNSGIKIIQSPITQQPDSCSFAAMANKSNTKRELLLLKLSRGSLGNSLPTSEQGQDDLIIASKTDLGTVQSVMNSRYVQEVHRSSDNREKSESTGPEATTSLQIAKRIDRELVDGDGKKEQMNKAIEG